MCTPAASVKEAPKLEVLVATMHQADVSLAEKMHLDKSAIIANQCDRWDYEERDTGHGRIRMISTRTRGVGINRNLALQLSTAEILLFADDDMTYYDGALEAVENAFSQLPDADVIFFGIDMTRNGEITDKLRNSVKRLFLWNSLKYGACRMAVRRESVVRARIGFSTLFGGGCIYGSGEDTLFICDCLRSGLKLYSHDAVLGACAEDTSSWFTGYNDKYFFDRGALLACAFPKMKHLMKWHFAIKLAKKSGVSLRRIIRMMNEGMRAFTTLTPYRAEDALQLGADADGRTEGNV